MGLLLAAALLLAPAASRLPPLPPAASITLRAPAAPRRFSLLTGVDRGPGCSGGASIAQQLRAAGTTLLRTHDAHVLDWCVLFPNASADPLSPASYAWAAGDEYFDSILAAGLQPYLRLGVSWSYPTPACIAPDPAVFAAVAVQTLRHYNDGWGGGRPAPPGSAPAVRFAEIWNEPDEAPRFWNSSAAQFYDLFDATARALKGYSAALQVGGPAVASPLSPASHSYSFGFLDAVAARGTPLDFFSWHSYGDIAAPPQQQGPHSPARIYNATITAVRGALAARGLGSVAQHITEWQPVILGSGALTGGAEAAAFTASALTFMASAPDVAVSVFYPACEGVGVNGSWGMFLDYGNGTVAWRREGRVWGAVGALLAAAPWALEAAAAPAAEDFTALAGANAPTASGCTAVQAVVAARLPLAGGGTRIALTAPLGGAPSGSWARVAVLLHSASAPEEGAWSNSTVQVGAGGEVAVDIEGFAPPAVAWVSVSAAAA